MIRSMLRHRVTVRKIARSSSGDRSVDETYADIPAYVHPVAESMADGTNQRVGVRAVVYFDADAPLDGEHPDWQIVHEGRDLDVLSIESVPGPIAGRTDHFKVLTR